MTEAEEAPATTENENGFIPSLSKPSPLLPIAKYRKQLLYTVETYPVTIVIGQTGSGKTTQLPQYLEQAGWCANGKVVAVTQVGNAKFNSIFITEHNRTRKSQNRLYLITSECSFCCQNPCSMKLTQPS